MKHFQHVNQWANNTNRRVSIKFIVHVQSNSRAGDKDGAHGTCDRNNSFLWSACETIHHQCWQLAGLPGRTSALHRWTGEGALS
jgi:hypothetical protein